MKLVVVVLALSCVVYATEKGQYQPTSGTTSPHWCPCEAVSQDSITSNVHPSDVNGVSQLPLDADYDRRLFDFRAYDDPNEDASVISEFNSRPHGQPDIVHRNNFVRSYGEFEPDALDSLSHNYGIGGGFRYRREAGRNLESGFRFLAEKQLGKREFVRSFTHLRRGAGSHEVDPVVAANY